MFIFLIESVDILLPLLWKYLANFIMIVVRGWQFGQFGAKLVRFYPNRQNKVDFRRFWSAPMTETILEKISNLHSKTWPGGVLFTRRVCANREKDCVWATSICGVLAGCSGRICGEPEDGSVKSQCNHLMVVPRAVSERLMTIRTISITWLKFCSTNFRGQWVTGSRLPRRNTTCRQW